MAAITAPGQTRDDKSDKSDCDDDRSRRDHRHGDGVEKLMIVEPTKLLHDALLQKWNDRQPATENECPGFSEEQKYLNQHMGRSVPAAGLAQPSFDA